MTNRILNKLFDFSEYNEMKCDEIQKRKKMFLRSFVKKVNEIPILKEEKLSPQINQLHLPNFLKSVDLSREFEKIKDEMFLNQLHLPVSMKSVRGSREFEKSKDEMALNHINQKDQLHSRISLKNVYLSQEFEKSNDDMVLNHINHEENQVKIEGKAISSPKGDRLFTLTKSNAIDICVLNDDLIKIISEKNDLTYNLPLMTMIK